MKTMTRRVPKAGAGLILAVLLGGIWLLPVGKAGADDASSLAVPAPNIPGVAQLPGPVADAATPIQNMGLLKVAPDHGVTGTPVTISGSGLAPGAAVTLTWSTANVTWMLDPQPSTVDYHGRVATPLAVVISHATTDASGAFSVTIK